MTTPLFIALALATGIAIGAFAVKRSYTRYERERFIRSYVFSKEVLDALQKSYPTIEEKDAFLVARALRTYFLIHARLGKVLIAMPSRAVDALWHEFILDTREYHTFCARAFGSYFHHVPASKMFPGVSSDAALRRTWRMACLEENINPRAATRLPLLFAIDAKLHIPDGNHYSLNRPEKLQTDSSGGGGCGGFACAGEGLSSADSGSSCGGDGGGCGGGCGGD
jgi:hypothetical protein